MAAVSRRDDVRLLRPLLAFDPATLRAIVAAAGLAARRGPDQHGPARHPRPATRGDRRRPGQPCWRPLPGTAPARAASRSGYRAGVGAPCGDLSRGLCGRVPGPDRRRGAGGGAAERVGPALPASMRRPWPPRPGPPPWPASSVQPAGRLGRLAADAGGGGGGAASGSARPARCGTAASGLVRCAGWFRSRRARREPAPLRRQSRLPGAMLVSCPPCVTTASLSAVPHLAVSHCAAMGAGSVMVSNACLPAAGAPFLAD